MRWSSGPAPHPGLASHLRIAAFSHNPLRPQIPPGSPQDVAVARPKYRTIRLAKDSARSQSGAMSSLRGTLWDGVALWRVRAAPEPDSAARAVALPVAWEEEEAAALAALASGG